MVSPQGLAEEVTEHLATLESAMDKQLGDADDPLLVSVRSGAKFSMPGMMETVLNVGLNDTSVGGLAARSEDERFALDSYRRLLQMFGGTVLHVDSEHFSEALDEAKHAKGTESDLDLDADDLRGLVETFKAHHQGADRARLPAGARASSSTSRSARSSTRGTPTAPGSTAARSGSRRTSARPSTCRPWCSATSAWTPAPAWPSPATRRAARRASTATTCRTPRARTSSPASATRSRLADMADIDQTSYDDLMGIMTRLERHYRDMCDIEFTVERGKLWMLQTRVGKRTPEAAFRIAVHMVDEGLIQMDEAVLRVTGDQLAQLMFPRFDESAERTLLAKGMNASPGAAVGKAVFDSDTAVEWADRGEDVILVRKETNPDDLRGMVAARGILTSRGGKTSHAAVVARGMGRTCVCGAESLDVDTKAKEFRVRDGETVARGRRDLHRRHAPARCSPAPCRWPTRSWSATSRARSSTTTWPTRSSRIMAHADGARRLRVRTNADTPEDAARARRFGAQGIGLCRTEHMFLGERRELVEKLIVAEDEAGVGGRPRRAAAAPAPGLHRDPRGDGRPAGDHPAARPAAARVPARPHRAERRGRPRRGARRGRRARRDPADPRPPAPRAEPDARPARRPARHPDPRPVPDAGPRDRGGGRRPDGRPRHAPRRRSWCPLVASVRELEIVRADIERVIAEVEEDRGVKLDIAIGTMIELPRAAFLADRIAKQADFFSFGTNDLTQMAWGFSRDDVESSFFSRYFEHGIFDVSPFESLDQLGVGGMVEMGTTKGRETKPDLKVGVCGEHGGDPLSVHFFDSVGLNYVSCSPFRVPVARLEAGRSVLGQR